MISTNFYFYFLFLFSLFFYFLLLFFYIWLQEGLRLLHPPIVPFSTYLPRHLWDCQLRGVLGFEADVELTGRPKKTNI